MNEMRTRLLEFWKAGVAAVNGRGAVAKWMSGRPRAFTHIAAVGKAATDMALGALETMNSDCPAIVVTKYGHADARLTGRTNIELRESAHPVPDQSSLDAGRALLDFVTAAPPGAHLLMLVSGGASSLAEVLEPPHTLSELGRLNEEMLAQALDITAMNARRRQFSRIKGGRLLGAFPGAKVTVLAISDVPGDDIAVIGSGIGDTGLCKAESESFVVASNGIARNATQAAAEACGHDVVGNDESLHGELADVADQVAERLIDGEAGIHVFGGEPFLELPENPGEGGRNQALALAVAQRIRGRHGIAFLAAGTDGGDGPGEAAGGFVTGESWDRTPGGEEAMRDADSGSWLGQEGGRIVTGPTGTNVMDLAIGWKLS